jgi:tRNA (cytosine38-C5)-methyltransferase
LSALHADLWLLSPSCQPYTVLNPQAKGALDPRAASFLHLFCTVLPDLVRNGSHPSHLLVENVAGFEVLMSRSLFATDSKCMRRPQARVILSYQI